MTEKDNNEINRTPRSADTRATKEARKPWSPPSMLDAPPAPEGYTYRWIRAELVGQEDRKNVTARLSEGFDLVRSEELDNFQVVLIRTRRQTFRSSSPWWFAFGKDSNETREEETPTMLHVQTSKMLWTMIS